MKFGRFSIYITVTQLPTHLATSISFRCGLSPGLSHNSCSVINALFLRSVGSTTYELLPATPETEPIKKYASVLTKRLFYSRATRKKETVTNKSNYE